MSDEQSSGPMIAAILLGVATFGLFIIELLLPTGGILAILCVVAAITSVTLGFIHDPTLGMVLLAVYAVAAPFMLSIGLRVAAKSPLGRKLVLSAEIPARTGAQPVPAPALPLLGEAGEAITPLRPAGFVRIGGRRLDATAEGDLIDAGTPIEVVSVRDGQLRVRAHRAEPPATV
jgi:membrane-bound serine protease (ClpP class)